MDPTAPILGGFLRTCAFAHAYGQTSVRGHAAPIWFPADCARPRFRCPDEAVHVLRSFLAQRGRGPRHTDFCVVGVHLDQPSLLKALSRHCVYRFAARRFCDRQKKPIQPLHRRGEPGPDSERLQLDAAQTIGSPAVKGSHVNALATRTQRDSAWRFSQEDRSLMSPPRVTLFLGMLHPDMLPESTDAQNLLRLSEVLAVPQQVLRSKSAIPACFGAANQTGLL